MTYRVLRTDWTNEIYQNLPSRKELTRNFYCVIFQKPHHQISPVPTPSHKTESAKTNFEGGERSQHVEAMRGREWNLSSLKEKTSESHTATLGAAQGVSVRWSCESPRRHGSRPDRPIAFRCGAFPGSCNGKLSALPKPPPAHK